ncbi:hypothetical protein [Brevibacillus reuszeri]|uniref:hypothetical protein n=1 Tax=Brevibacillus reuszeri TaxID=54915 RepID=UPI002898E5F5|nr:hypothetical protein [Brevibacillus reuszeri]
MEKPSNPGVAKTPPSRVALRHAYELILTRIMPRLSSSPQSTCRRMNHEDQIDSKRNHNHD